VKEYTICSIAAAVFSAWLDSRLETGVLRKGAFWLTLGVMFAFMLLANGYLTWRPVVLYNSAYFMGVRLGTIPLEDFVYGFSIITLSVVLWERLKKRVI
jgi:lycopene cyclase domain-containing protein